MSWAKEKIIEEKLIKEMPDFTDAKLIKEWTKEYNCSRREQPGQLGSRRRRLRIEIELFQEVMIKILFGKKYERKSLKER